MKFLYINMLKSVLVFTLITLSCFVRADLESAYSWLSNQQSTEAGAIYTDNDNSYPIKSTLHAALALNLENQSYNQSQALEFLMASKADDLEFLAGVSALGVVELENNKSIKDLLLARQNEDGGFGNYNNFDTNPYDSSFALSVFNSLGETGEPIVKLLLHLMSAQKDNGSWEGASISTVARILEELQPWRSSYRSLSAVQVQAADYLDTQLSENNVELFHKAAVLKALAYTGYLPDLQESLQRALVTEQLSDGSWKGDVYLTALVLSALYAHQHPNVNLENGWIKGRIVHFDTGVPLSNVLVRAESLASDFKTDSNGEFLITGAALGLHTLNITLAGINSAVHTVNYAGESVNIGTLFLQSRADSYHMQGQVIDAHTGEGLAGIKVALSGEGEFELETDSQGRFIATGLLAGDYGVTIEQGGFYSVQETLTVAVGSQPDLLLPLVSSATVLTNNPVTVSALIVNGDSGEALADANFNLIGKAAVTTTYDGYASIDGVPHGRYQASVSASGFNARKLDISLPKGSSGFLGAIKLYPVAESDPLNSLDLSFEILDATTSKPLENAEITLIQTANTLSTDVEGKAIFENLSISDYQIRIGLDGFKTTYLELDNQGAGVIQRTVYLSSSEYYASTLFGSVADMQTGEPVVGAEVEYRGYFNGILTGYSDAAGYYEFTELNSDDATLYVSTPGYRQHTSMVAVETSQGDDVEFSPRLIPGLVENTAITGQVTDWVTKTGMVNVLISFGPEAARQQVLTDQQGYFLIDNITDLEIDLKIEYEGYDAQELTVVPKIDYVTDIQNVRLIPTDHEFAYQLRGRVVDSESLEPLSHVELIGIVGGATQKIYTEDDGTFFLDDLSSPTGRIALYLDGYLETAFNVGLVPDEVTDYGDFKLKLGSGYLLQPELNVSDVWIDNTVTAPASGLIGGVVDAMLVNYGHRFSGEIPIDLVAFYDVDQNGEFDLGADTELGRITYSEVLIREEELVVNIPVTGILPFRGAPVSVVVDVSDAVEEQNEGNNITGSAEGCTAVQPDLETPQELLGWEKLRIPISFNHAGTPTWILADENKIVRTSGNNPDSVFLSGDDRSGTFVWSMEVRTTGDDDGQGFVWGLQDKNNYYKFLWNQGNCKCAYVQLRVGGASAYFERNYDVRWKDNVKYFGYLDYRPGRSKVSVRQAETGEEVFSLVLNDATYESGDYGFFNSSQSANYFEYFLSDRISTSDLAIGKVSIHKADNKYKLSAEIGNGGYEKTPQGAVVRFYQGDPSEGGVLLSEEVIPPLSSGQSTVVTGVSSQTIADGAEIFAVLDEPQTVNECYEGNNNQQVVWAEPSATLALTLSDDQLSAGETLAVTASITNNSSATQDYSLQWYMLDAQGLRINLSTQSIPQLASAADAEAAASWVPISNSPAGAYVIHAELHTTAAPLGVVATDQAFFTVNLTVIDPPTGDGASGAYGADIDTDKLSYPVWDAVQIDTSIGNQTTNAIHEPALARVMIHNDSSDLVFQAEHVVDRLFAGNSEQRQYQFSLADTAPGPYAATIQLYSADGSELLASNSSQFDVVALATSDLSGAVIASADRLYSGESLDCTLIAHNNAAANNYSGKLRLSIINAATDTLVRDEEINVDLSAGGEWRESYTINTDTLDSGDYVCRLAALSGESEKVLGFDAFRVLQSPVSLETTLELSNQNRLLVLLDEPEYCALFSQVEVELKMKPKWFGYKNKSVKVKIFDQAGSLIIEQLIQGGDQHTAYGAGLVVDLLVSHSGRLNMAFKSTQGVLPDSYRVEASTQYRDRDDTESWDLNIGCERCRESGKWLDGYRITAFTPTEGQGSGDFSEPFGPVGSPLLSEQRVALAELLRSAGWSYTFVDSAQDFTVAMLTDGYDAYALLAEKAHLDAWAMIQVRERVHAGAGLLIAGQHDTYSRALNPALGIQIDGLYTDVDGYLTSSEDTTGAWVSQWDISESVLALSLNGAQALAYFQGVADSSWTSIDDTPIEPYLKAMHKLDKAWFKTYVDDGACENVKAGYGQHKNHCKERGHGKGHTGSGEPCGHQGHDDKHQGHDNKHQGHDNKHQGHGDKNHGHRHHHDCSNNEQTPAIAIALHRYGQGHAVVAGFDWVLQLAVAGLESNVADDLVRGLELIQPTETLKYPGASQGVALHINNLGMTVPGRVLLNIENTQLLDAGQFQPSDSLWEWLFEIESGDNTSQYLQFSLPPVGQQASIQAYIQTGEAGNWDDWGQLDLELVSNHVPASIAELKLLVAQLAEQEGRHSKWYEVNKRIEKADKYLTKQQHEKAQEQLLLAASRLLEGETENHALVRILLLDVSKAIASHIN